MKEDDKEGCTDEYIERTLRLLYLYGVDTSNVVIDKQGYVNVEGDVILNSACNLLKKLPFHFKSVSGNFSVPNASLTSLWGFPIFIGGNLRVNDCILESLVGFPKIVNNILCFKSEFETNEDNLMILNHCGTPLLSINEKYEGIYERFVTIKQILE
jgi:hypothetical protein